jgi:hypothetical protein
MAMQRMVKVSVEVCSGSARFRVSVRTKSIRRALGLVEGRYPPREVRLVCPIEPEGFSTREPAALPKTAVSEMPRRRAA